MPNKSTSNSNPTFFQQAIGSSGQNSSKQTQTSVEGEYFSNFIARLPIIPAKDGNGNPILRYATEEESPEDSRIGVFKTKLVV